MFFGNKNKNKKLSKRKIKLNERIEELGFEKVRWSNELEEKGMYPHRIMITGEKGMGKTFIINNLLKSVTKRWRIKEISFSSSTFENKKEIVEFIKGYRSLFEKFKLLMETLYVFLSLTAITSFATFIGKVLIEESQNDSLPEKIVENPWLFVLSCFLPFGIIYLIYYILKWIKSKFIIKWVIFEDVNRLSMNSELNSLNVLWETSKNKMLKNKNIIYEFSYEENNFGNNELKDGKYVTYFLEINRSASKLINLFALWNKDKDENLFKYVETKDYFLFEKILEKYNYNFRLFESEMIKLYSIYSENKELLNKNLITFYDFVFMVHVFPKVSNVDHTNIGDELESFLSLIDLSGKKKKTKPDKKYLQELYDELTSKYELLKYINTFHNTDYSKANYEYSMRIFNVEGIIASHYKKEKKSVSRVQTLFNVFSEVEKKYLDIK